MSLFEESLRGQTIEGVYVDSEVTYLMLEDGTHVTIRGTVMVEPGASFYLAERACRVIAS